jgi:hypothetical protein
VITRLTASAEGGRLGKGTVSYPEGGDAAGRRHLTTLSNIYLHEVDKWLRRIRPARVGRTFMVRYADDFVMARATGGRIKSSG